MTRGQSWLFLGVRRSPARSRAPCRARCAVVKRIARARSFLKVITARLSWDSCRSVDSLGQRLFRELPSGRSVRITLAVDIHVEVLGLV
jgi:hypothetical protein